MPQPKLPNKLKLLRGSSKVNMNKSPQTDSVRSSRMWPCPTFMGPYGKQLWQTLGPDLMKQGLLTIYDQTAFQMLCSTYDHIVSITFALSDAECLIDDRGNTKKKNPLFSQLNALTTQYIKLLGEFGLSPNSRSKLGIEIDNSNKVKVWIRKPKPQAWDDSEDDPDSLLT